MDGITEEEVNELTTALDDLDAMASGLRYENRNAAARPMEKVAALTRKLLAQRAADHETIRQLRVALADAIRRPMGVVPDSAIGLIDGVALDGAEARRIARGEGVPPAAQHDRGRA